MLFRSDAGLEVLTPRFFNEIAVRTKAPAAAVVDRLASAGILAGVPYARLDPAAGLDDVLLLAATTGYQIRSFSAAAERLGVHLVFASDRCDRLEDPWLDEAIPIRFQDPLAAADVIARHGPFDGVLAVGDRPALLAGYATSALGLAGNPPEAASASRNKLEARAAFSRAGLPTPAFRECAVSDDPHEIGATLSYPCEIGRAHV